MNGKPVAFQWVAEPIGRYDVIVSGAVRPLEQDRSAVKPAVELLKNLPVVPRVFQKAR